MFFWNMIGALFFLPALAWLFGVRNKVAGSGKHADSGSGDSKLPAEGAIP